MKKLIAIIFVAGTLAVSSCSDWLDVKSRMETSAEDLFSTQKGFRNALTGAYIKMKGTNLYGSAMTWGTMEWLSQHWQDRSQLTQYQPLKNYDYKNQYAESAMANVFQGLYDAIAAVNGILQEIDSKKNVFAAGNYELIKGEALGLRAFFHMDVLRLFGPIPTSVSGSDLILPYVTTVSTAIHEYSTYAEYTTLLLKDLNDAEELLALVDPILDYSIADLNPSSSQVSQIEDLYLVYRQVRMNYYAILAQKARYYMWVGDKGNARTYANKVINAKSPNGSYMYRLGSGNDMAAQDYTLSSEHIFALDDHNLETRAYNTFVTSETFRQMDYYYGVVYNNITTDMRRTYLWVADPRAGGYSYMRKYVQKATNPINQIPVIRLAEMHLIVAECAETVDEGKALFNAFLETRGVPAKPFTNIEELHRDITKEYGREFYGEGQYFFACKRVNSATIELYYSAIGPQTYIVPLPEGEIKFTNN